MGEDHLAANHHNGTLRPHLDAEKGSREFETMITEICCSTCHRIKLSWGDPTDAGSKLMPTVMMAPKLKLHL